MQESGAESIIRYWQNLSVVVSQISELNHVNLPVMLMPDDFKAFTKIRVDNHMFNK